MTQQTNNTGTFTINVTYFTTDFNDGQMIERKTTQPVEFFHLMRRNQAHSKYAIKILGLLGSDQSVVTDEAMQLAQEYVKIACTNEKVAEDICMDICACLEIYANKAVKEDLERFFGTWDFLSTPLEKVSKKK